MRSDEVDWKCGVGKGWHPLVDAWLLLAEALGARPVQIKEKFGGLRIYFYLPESTPEDAGVAFMGFTGKLEALSLCVCEACGSLEDVSTKAGKAGSGFWIQTLCNKCREGLA